MPATSRRRSSEPAADRHLEPTSPRQPIALIALGASAAVATSTFLYWGGWFAADEWAFLLDRSLSRPTSLLQPHGDHLQAIPAIILQIDKMIAGFDYAPWYAITSALAVATSGAATVLAVRWQGQSLPAAFVAGLLAWFPVGAVVQVGHIGGPLGRALALLGVSVLVGRYPPTRSRSVAFALLLAAVATASSAVFVAFGLLLTLIASRRRLALLWPPAAALSVYGLWIFLYRDGAPARAWPPVNDTVRTLVGMLDSAGVLHIRFLPGWIVVLGLSTFVVVLIVRRSLTAFDSVLLLATVGYGAAVTATRIAAAPETTVDTRFGLVAADFLIPVLFAHMPRLDRRRAVILVAGIVLIAVVNTSARHQANTTWGAAGTARRSLLNNAVALVRAGEPMVESRNLDLSGFGSGINQTRLQQLASAGLAVDLDGDREWIRRARGELRMHVWPSGAVNGPPPAVWGDHGVSPAGCVRLKDGDRVAMDVAGPATISLTGSVEDEILLRWRDDLGYGDRSVPSGKLRHPFRPGYVTVALAAPPPGGAELEVHAVATTDGVAVCGLVADDAAPD